MGSDMILRDLYLPANSTVNLTAAMAKATDLCRQATHDDLSVLLDNGWLNDETLTGVAWSDDWSTEWLDEHAEALRSAAEHCLHRLLDQLAASLSHRDVARFRFDRGPESGTDPTHGDGVDAYFTGGPSWGDSPTETYDDWDIVCDTGKFPDHWPDQIGVAAGLLHPRGDGPAIIAVTFYAWA